MAAQIDVERHAVKSFENQMFLLTFAVALFSLFIKFEVFAAGVDSVGIFSNYDYRFLITHTLKYDLVILSGGNFKLDLKCIN